MDPDEDTFRAVREILHIPGDQCKVLDAVDITKDVSSEVTESGRHRRGGDFIDTSDGVGEVLCEVDDMNHRQPVCEGEVPESPSSQHLAVVSDELANDPDLGEPGQTQEIHCGFGVSGPFEDTTASGTQGKHVTRATEVFRSRVGTGQGA